VSRGVIEIIDERALKERYLISRNGC